MRDRTIFRHAMRGLEPLPHVGHHPGIPVAIILLGLGAAAGAQRAGLLGALMGLCFAALWVLPLLLIGSVDRSRLSDRLDGKYAPLAQLDRAADF
jgi:hypothetical protein